MSFKDKMKNIIGDVKWEDLDHKKVYIALGAVVAVIVLMIVLIVSAVSGSKKQNADNPKAVIEETAETEEVSEENPLEVDAYDEVIQLVQQYFEGLSIGSISRVARSVDVLSDEEINAIEKKKDYIESYNDIICYTKEGLEEDSFVVFASYEMKFYNIDTPAPGIMALYVVNTGEEGYRIFNGDASDELKDYVLELAAEEEVAAIISEVDARYQQLIAEDEELGKFAQTMLASQQAAEDEGETAEEPSEGDAKELEEPVETTVNDGIRIREGRSTETRMLATIVSGTKVKVYANYSDGWSKIEYSGTIGHCKTEFLTSTEGVPMLNVDAAAEEEPETTEAETAESETTAGNAEVTSVNKEMQFKETVRIRKEATTESERIGTGYENNLVKVIESYSNGWSKIDYNGLKGYCMTEYLEEAR